MEGRHCFGHLTIEENLLTGAFTRRDGRAAIARDIERVYAYFPAPEAAPRSLAGYVSGGEQQMCALGRAMMAKPKLILLDEPSMGLAPQVVEEIFEIVQGSQRARRRLVPARRAERQHRAALRRVRLHPGERPGRARRRGERAARQRGRAEFYLGVAGAERRSFRDVKSYKRRKRWLA